MRTPVTTTCVDVAGTRDSQRLPHPAGTAAQQSFVGNAAALAHHGNSSGGLQRTHQHARTMSDLSADHVETPVDAIRQIDVRMSGRPEHRGVAHTASSVAMRCRIFSVVRLGFHNASANAIQENDCPDKGSGDLQRRSLEINAGNVAHEITRALSESRQGAWCNAVTAILAWTARRRWPWRSPGATRWPPPRRPCQSAG